MRRNSYYIDRSTSGDRITFHAFRRGPSRHYEVIFWQEVDYAQFQIEVARRKEVRAEMKGFDYCVSILDKNH